MSVLICVFPYQIAEELLGDHSYRYLTADEMRGLGDDSTIDVTRDERANDVFNSSLGKFRFRDGWVVLVGEMFPLPVFLIVDCPLAFGWIEWRWLLMYKNRALFGVRRASSIVEWIVKYLACLCV